MKKLYFGLGVAVLLVVAFLVFLSISKKSDRNSRLGGRTFEVTHTLLNASSSLGFASPIRVDDYRNLVVQASVTNTPTMTIKFAGSNSDDAPNFSLPQSVANHWDYLEVVDLEDGASIDGDAGWVPSGKSDVRNFEVNTELVTWLSVEITTSSPQGPVAGTTTIKIKYGTNS